MEVGSRLLTNDSSIADDNLADETLYFDTVASPDPDVCSREQTFISARGLLDIGDPEPSACPDEPVLDPAPLAVDSLGDLVELNRNEGPRRRGRRTRIAEELQPTRRSSRIPGRCFRPPSS